MSLKIVFATLLSLFITVNAINMKNEDFTNNFEDVCYSRPEDFSKPLPLIITKWNNDRSNLRRGQNYENTFKEGPISMSVESLISIIEKIEARKPKLEAKELAMMLLKKYRLDDVVFVGNLAILQAPDSVTKQYEVEDAVLGVDSTSIDTTEIDNILDMDENCTLHFLLSHNIDIVAKSGDKSSSPFRQSAPQGQPNGGRTEFKPRYSVASLPKNSQVTKWPREYGVGTFRQNQEQAILLNKLLLGVIAGLTDTRSVTVANVYSNFRREQPLSSDLKLRVDSVMDPLVAVTLASVLSYGSYTDEQQYQNLFGATGKWNSSLCAVEFDLDIPQDINDVKDIPGVAATMAEIRGAMDAYSIGKALRQLRESNGNSKSKKELKLSQILRLYYSPLGFEPSTTEYGYCKREQFRIDQSEIVSNAESFKRSLILASAGNAKIDDKIVTGPIDQVKQEFFSKMELAKKIPADDREWCESVEQRSNKLDDRTCETRSDVFILVDQLTSDTEKLELQYKIVNKLARNLDIRRFGSSLTILGLSENSTRGPEGQRSFDRIAWEETNKGCATCKLAFADLSNLATNFDPQSLPDLINGTLYNFELERQYETAVPSRTFIIINFGSLATAKVNTYRFNQARSTLNTYHRNTKILVVSDTQNYDYLVDSREKDFFMSDSQDVAEKLLKRICETPAVFQHPECHLKPSQNLEYTGYLTPGHVQHWAMYPQFFYKSFNIEFLFKAEKGKLRVCHAKTERPGFENQNGVCYENKDTDEIRFNRENPCHKFTRESCAPFYFTIYGTDETAVNPYCKDEQCANMKQIQFTFTHTGISCNKAFGITFSPFLVIMAILAAIAVHKHNNKFF